MCIIGGVHGGEQFKNCTESNWTGTSLHSRMILRSVRRQKLDTSCHPVRCGHINCLPCRLESEFLVLERVAMKHTSGVIRLRIGIFDWDHGIKDVM